MSVLFCVSFLAFYLQPAPFMSYLCIGKTKEKLPRAHRNFFSCAHEKKTKDERRKTKDCLAAAIVLNNNLK